MRGKHLGECLGEAFEAWRGLENGDMKITTFVRTTFQDEHSKC
jgi:hypothetical protein